MQALNSEKASLRSPLKWAGGKFKLVDKIRAQLPSGKRLIEPFVGGASVFLNTDYESYLLSDSSCHLINFYQVLQRGGQGFIEHCESLFVAQNNTQERYLELRAFFNSLSDTDEVERIVKAALFLYLNRHCFNGLMRTNKSGKFNVSFGSYKAPYFPSAELNAFLAKLERCDARFVCQDFTDTLSGAVAGDVVYCDPPYIPLSDTANFTSYSGPFNWAHQQLLWSTLKDLVAKGVSSVISNHETVETVSLYKGATIQTFDVQRSISCKARGKAPELLATLLAA